MRFERQRSLTYSNAPAPLEYRLLVLRSLCTRNDRELVHLLLVLMQKSIFFFNWTTGIQTFVFTFFFLCLTQKNENEAVRKNNIVNPVANFKKGNAWDSTLGTDECIGALFSYLSDRMQLSRRHGCLDVFGITEKKKGRSCIRRSYRII